MSRHRLRNVLFFVLIGWLTLPIDQMLLSFTPTAVAEDSVVTFDVPAILSVREIPLNGTHAPSPTQKTIEVIVPVTSEIRMEDQGTITAFRFDVYWNRNPFPICDYGPKTQTFSEIDGTIAIEKSNDKNSTIGLNLSGGYQNLITGTSKAELGDRESAKVLYREIPQHEVLIAAGTIHRGTGAFFRFHPSRLETLEGGRDLMLVFQVPFSWRGGMLQVECTATGNRKVIAWHEPYEIRRAFVVPIYLESDEKARESAMEFVRREQMLRSRWQQHQSKQTASNLIGAKTTVFSNSFFNGATRSQNTGQLPADWVHFLIQKDDAPLEKYRSQLPEDLATAASEFVHSRSELLKFSR